MDLTNASPGIQRSSIIQLSMEPDRLPSWERHFHVFPPLVPECLEESEVDGFSPWTLWSRGEEHILQYLQMCTPVVFSFVSLDFCLGFPPYLECLFHTLWLYLYFKPQASSTLGQLPSFHILLAPTCPFSELPWWSVFLSYLFMCLSFPTICRHVHLYMLPNRLFGL